MPERESHEGHVRLNNAFLDEHGPVIGADGLAVLWVLMRHRNYGTGRCDPSMRRIARSTGLSVGRVKKVIEHLAGLGILGVEERRIGETEGRRSNQYALPPTLSPVLEAVHLTNTPVHGVNAPVHLTNTPVHGVTLNKKIRTRRSEQEEMNNANVVEFPASVDCPQPASRGERAYVRVFGPKTLPADFKATLDMFADSHGVSQVRAALEQWQANKWSATNFKGMIEYVGRYLRGETGPSKQRGEVQPSADEYRRLAVN